MCRAAAQRPSSSFCARHRSDSRLNLRQAIPLPSVRRPPGSVGIGGERIAQLTPRATIATAARRASFATCRIRVLAVTQMPADQATPVTTSPKGAEPGQVGRWLAERLGDSRWRDCELSSIGHGRSNLTYRVSSPAGAVVPRRRPVGPVAALGRDLVAEALT
jgi:hypothetical protein